MYSTQDKTKTERKKIVNKKCCAKKTITKKNVRERDEATEGNKLMRFSYVGR